MKHLTSFIQCLNLRRCFTIYYLLPSTLMLFSITSCSTQKNTGASRAWHELKVIHNVQFNGEKAYKEGMEQLNQAHTDNFATFLPLYPVSDHKAAESSASSMDKAIDKSRKSIKMHSIKVRPKVNPKKRKDEKYQNWLKNKEFNNQMYRAWLMLGQSEFHKGDFLGSVGTFRYIEKLYENDANMVALCQLWIARAYGELDWIYEAEDILSKVQVDNLNRKNEPYYSAVSADILLKGEHYKEAIPYLKLAKQNEKRNGYLPRFEYVLAQAYQHNQQPSEARAAYKRVYQLHPKDVNMEFNARIHYAELKGDTAKSMKQLRQMTKLYKYKDNLDQLYGVMGNIYLANHDTTQALHYYQLGIESSTQNGNEKAQVLVKAGDLYFDRCAYTQASPCYHEASTILPNDHPDYARVSHRSEILDDVVAEIQIVDLQDSLQRLGHLSYEEQLAVVEKLIFDLKEKEKSDSIAQKERDREQELETERGGLQSVDMSRMIGGRTGAAANWYFYNPQLMRSGKQEFTKQWGNRGLEDNWRRLSKASLTTTDTPDSSTPEDSSALAQTPADATTDIGSGDAMDVYNPQYYLQQIPKTESDYAASDALIADALYKLVYLYRDRMNNPVLSDRTFADFLRRFPQEERLVELYYNRYLYALRTQQIDTAAYCRDQILTRYPESAQAKIVSNPDYFESLKRMAIEQDSLYESTYEAYRHNDFQTIKANKAYAETTYPLTPLMPRLLFLNAVATAKTEGQDAFVATLRDMVNRYPTDPLSAMAKDMLAMMTQGMEAQQGSGTTTLMEQRQISTEEITDTTRTFSSQRTENSFVYIVIANDEPSLNNLLYEVALFNFSQFLIKDFDLRKVPIFSSTQSALEIKGFDSMDEADWYISILQSNADLQTFFSNLNATIFPITESNSQLLNRPFTLEDYLNFSTR